MPSQFCLYFASDSNCGCGCSSCYGFCCGSYCGSYCGSWTLFPVLQPGYLYLVAQLVGAYLLRHEEKRPVLSCRCRPRIGIQYLSGARQA